MDPASPLLHRAAATGNELLLTELLSQPGCPPLDQRDSLGLTPVHYAAALPSAACLRALLEAGGQPNCKDSDGMRPLHRAALCGSAECCHVLLLAGAEVGTPTEPGGLTPLLLAVSQGHRRLLVWEEGDEAHADAASSDSSSGSSSSSPSSGGGDSGSGWDASTCHSSLEDFGSDHKFLAFAEERDAAGSTLLHQAAAQGQLAAVAALANKRTNCTRDGAGLLPLQAAAKAGQRGAAMLLLSCQRGQHSWSDWKAGQEEEKAYWQQVEEQERQREQQAAAPAAPLQQAVTLSRRRLRFNFNHLNYKAWTVEQWRLQEELCKKRAEISALKRSLRRERAAGNPAQPESPATPEAAAAAELAAALLLEAEERAAAAAAAAAAASASPGKKQSQGKQKQRQAAASTPEPEEAAGDEGPSTWQPGGIEGSESSTAAVAPNSPLRQVGIAPSTPSRGTQGDDGEDSGQWQVSRRKGKKAGRLPPPPPVLPAPPKQQVAVQRQQQQSTGTFSGATKPACSSAALAALAAAAPAAAAVLGATAAPPAAPAAAPPATVVAALVPAADVPGSAGAAAAGEAGADAAVAELLDHLGISHLDLQPAAGESSGRASLAASAAGRPAAAAGQEPLAAPSAGISRSAAAGADPPACPLAGLHHSLLAELHCPITTEPMRDPVVAADGSSYERAAIEAWINRQLVAGQAPASPLTGAPLASLSLRENRIARMLVASLQAAGQLPH